MKRYPELRDDDPTTRVIITRDDEPLPKYTTATEFLYRFDADRSYHGQRVHYRQIERYRRAFNKVRGNARKERWALWGLLRVVFPWRFSYKLYGDPVHFILDGGRDEHTRVLAAIVTNVLPDGPEDPNRVVKL